MAETPNFYSTMHQLAASSSWAAGFIPGDLLVFGFPAVGATIYNSCDVRVFFSLGGTPSTNSAFIAGCSQLTFSPIPPTGGFGLLATTSSTAAGGKPVIGVSAWASA